jgi:hypothetical protein
VAILTRDALLTASDLKEKEIELPSIGGSVRIRSLAAEYSNAAVSEAVKVTEGPKGEAITTIDNTKLELLIVFHGLVEPKLESLAAVQTFGHNCGPAFKTLVHEINELSGITKEAVEATVATFPALGGDAAGPSGPEASNGSGGPDLHARAGA